MRLYKIVMDGQIIYLEPSLGPETEWPIGLIPSKEEKPVLKPLFKRFEDEIKIAESTTQDIVIEDKVLHIRSLVKGVFSKTSGNHIVAPNLCFLS